MSAASLQSVTLAREGFRHGFFTRQGGVSEGPFESLSFVVGTGDAEDNVAENRRRAAVAMGVTPGRLYYASQVHGVGVVELTGDEAPADVVRRTGDVTLSDATGVACGVRSADCAPILVADRRTGAVAAIHSGWRGTVLRVVVAAVQSLVAKTRGSPSTFVAAIGPHIEASRFEVGRDVAAQLADASRAGAAVIASGRDDDHPLVDMRAILRAQLREAGLADEDIDDVRGCTFSEPDRFFSYRRDGKVGGRLLSAVCVRG